MPVVYVFVFIASCFVTYSCSHNNEAKTRQVTQTNFGSVNCRDSNEGTFTEFRICEFKTKNTRFCKHGGQPKDAVVDCAIYDDMVK